jgi:hypothetical protein
MVHRSGKVAVGMPLCLRYYVDEGEEVKLLIPQVKVTSSHGAEVFSLTCNKYPGELAGVTKPVRPKKPRPDIW